MEKLSETWMVDGTIDFETKKYTLLAYLQKVKFYFDNTKVYPQLADLFFHNNNLVSFKENKNYLKEHFPKRFSGIQIENLELVYEEIISDNNLMQEIEEIIHYASNRFKNAISVGSEIYDFVESKISISPVGILPLKTDEGYFLLANGKQKGTKVYSYRMTLFERHNEKYRSLSTTYISEWERGFVNSYENIKLNLIKQQKHLPNPAVYSIETEMTFPLEETLLPIAKRTLVQFISN
ncbi:hypothetical protein Emtol_3822 [Emticicia oligotrophica DSM 17448]|uniref:DUF4143 domain-containing protein n=1 Tax=Emticicia oligotrophica (strain DSM 17448 / CIP 109782 / MTCC 6937 / GPTSA100-15) TaxID=929562 RepID=A0ABN4AR86_EMTOG|nr:hypothetical protein [Emticicia oligotrophica]AFK04948.1 hypothetical protein Emtol_3822 [Emticicia oligotrophica DSM 17448]